MVKALRIFFLARGARPLPVLVCLVLGTFAEGVGLAILLPVMSIALGEDESTRSAAASMLIDALHAVGLPSGLFVLVTLVAIAVILKNLLLLAAMTYVGYSVAEVATGLRRDLIANLLRVRWSYFTEQPLGRLTNALSVEANRAANAYRMAAMALVCLVQIVVYTGVAFFVSWQLALIGILSGGAIAAMLSFLIRAAKSAGRRQTRYTSQLITYLSDTLNNIRPLKAMGRENSFGHLLEEALHGLRKAFRREVIVRQALRGLDETLAVVGLGYGLALAITWGKVSPSEVTITVVLLLQILNAVSRFQKQLQNAAIQESAYYAVEERIRETAAARERDQGWREPELKEGIRLDRVCFSHPRTPVLREVTMDFPRGEISVLTGPSGSGKTTVTDLIIGFRTPDSGAVLVDGHPLEEYRIERWRAMIGYVPQELVLFHDTIFANVALGDPAITEEEVSAALRAAGALGFVESLPEGLHTQVGEKGVKMSGGQRQRIALARALVKKPKLLILDEVTSALDPDAEAGIVANIRALRGETTVIAITHRPAFLSIADKVWELLDGQVVPGRRPRPISAGIA